jgi:O-antigen ligase
LRYFALGLAITVLAMTRSATGLIVFIAFVCGVPLVRLVRTRPKLWVSVVIVLLAAGATVGTVLVNNSALVLALLGRSSTLTGRIDIWRAALVPIMNRPFLGYGFDAFWLGAKGESGLIDRTVHYLVPHAHNGALELLLNLGAIGLALFVVAYTLYVGKSLRFYLRQHNYLRVWPLAYMAFMFLYNVTEVTDISGNNIFAMLFAAVAITVTLRTPEMETDENEYAPTCDYKSELVYLS